jgi:hypothetical protein
MAIRERRLASAAWQWFAMCRTKAEATKTTIEATTKQASAPKVLGRHPIGHGSYERDGASQFRGHEGAHEFRGNRIAALFAIFRNLQEPEDLPPTMVVALAI